MKKLILLMFLVFSSVSFGSAVVATGFIGDNHLPGSSVISTKEINETKQAVIMIEKEQEKRKVDNYFFYGIFLILGLGLGWIFSRMGTR